MKVAYITRSFGKPSESFVRDLVLGLARDYDVKVFANTCHQDDSSRAVDLVKETNFLDCPRGFLMMAGIISRITAIDRSRLDYAFRRKWLETKLLRQVKAFDPEVVFIDYGITAALTLRMVSDLNLPYVVHFHGFDVTSALSVDWYRDVLPRVVSEARAVVVPSQHLRRLLAVEIGTRREITCVPCGPDLDLVTVIKDEVSPQPFRVCALGRLTAKKNPLALIEAFKIVVEAVPEARLDWIGDGELRGKVEQRISEYNLHGRITMHGALPHRDALEILAGASVFVQHSVTSLSGDQEGLPVAILEAIAMGVPVVSTIHSGIPEAVEAGVDGFLVPEHNYELMAERIVGLLTKEAILTQEAGRNNRFSAAQRLESISSLLGNH